MEEKYCNQCENKCPKEELKCGRGRKYFANSLEEKGEMEKSHKFERPNAAYPGRHHNTGDLENKEDLDSLMRACGHFLYHSSKEKSGQGRIMCILSRQEEINQKELQDMLGIQPGSISEILAKLESKGFIKRVKDGEDKRKTVVKITEAGKLHAEEYHKQHKRSDRFAALNEEQKEQLKVLLQILLESWK